MPKAKKSTCPKNSQPITLWHGTSLKRAKSITEKGFADTREIPEEMREGMGGVGEHGVTYFFVESHDKETFINENNEKFIYNPTKNGAYYHASRVAKEDKDVPAIIESKACLFHPISEINEQQFASELKDFAENKVDQGDQRWFRTYSIDKRGSPMFNIQSVATRNLSMREIMDAMKIDALFENKRVIVLANPNKNIIKKKIITNVDEWVKQLD